MTRTTTVLAGAIALAPAFAGCARESEARGGDDRYAFHDVARAAGVTLVQTSGDARRWYIPESNGMGAAWLDADADGDLDLFVGNGQRVRYEDGGKQLAVERGSKSTLYRNDRAKGGAARFSDVGALVGLAREDWVQAVATGDVDADGDTDLFLGNLGPDALLLNERGKFRDSSKESGLGSPLWAAGAAFGDGDDDGDLDLYVANYCEWSWDAPPNDGKPNVIDGVTVGWGPIGENGRFNPGAPDRYYVNDGHGRFREATREAGLELDHATASYGVVWSDVNGDGKQDLLVANDMQPCHLFVNQGGGRFAEEGAARGFALCASGKPSGAMGLMVADVDLDGDQDVFRSNFDLEPNALHVNDGNGRFEDQAGALGLEKESIDRLGWGGAFFDADCDGDLELFVANGHVYPQAKEIGMSGWLMGSQLWEQHRRGDGTFGWRDASARTGGELARPAAARGAALADFDDDGDLDLVVTAIDAAPRLFVNDTERRGRWIAVRAQGSRSNRDGYGALVSVSAGGVTRAREVRTNDGLFSAHDPRVHFGLGDVEEIDEVVVRWPSGSVSRVAKPALDAVLLVAEPALPEEEEGG